MSTSLIARALKKLGRYDGYSEVSSVADPDEHVTRLLRSPVLPTLLCEEIIDCVAGDTRVYGKLWGDIAIMATLRACSLTCRAWTPRSQYHLFAFLNVRCSQKQVKNVVALLDRNPALRSRIECLVLRPPGRFLPQLYSIPPELVEALSQVQELRISTSHVEFPRGSSMEASLRGFAAVTTLNLFSTTFASFDDLRRTIVALPQIRSLVIDIPLWILSKPSPAHLIASPATVRLKEMYLTVSAAWLQDPRGIAFFQWLALSGAVLLLEKILIPNMAIMNDAACAALRGVIEASSKTLEQLTFSPGQDYDYTSLCAAVGGCTNLRSLAVIVPYHIPAFSHLVSFLSSPLLSCPMILVRFNEYPSKCMQPTADEWKSLDEVFQGPQWSSVVFLLVCRMPKQAPSNFKWGEIYRDDPFDVSTVRQQVIRDMPLSYKRGIMYHLCGMDGKNVERL